jgi:hypothetical protein
VLHAGLTAECAASDGSWTERGVVFPNRVGAFAEAKNLCSRHFKPLFREAGLPEIRFHDLRNTCTTLLLTRGVHPKIVKEILGHANICITLDTYSHVIPGLVQLQDRFWVMICSGALASWLTGAARSFLSAYKAALSLPGRSPDHALGKAAAGAMDDALSLAVSGGRVCCSTRTHQKRQSARAALPPRGRPPRGIAVGSVRG